LARPTTPAYLLVSGKLLLKELMEAERFLKLPLLLAGLFKFFNRLRSISLSSRTRLSSSSSSEDFLSSYYLLFSLAKDEGTCGRLLESIVFFVVGVPLFM
jgi:hypothetical protein